MKMVFRWYGDSDPVTLENISQIPVVDGVVTAVYNVPVGQVWGTEEIETLKQKANKHNLSFEVIESVPVHEEIKLGTKNRDALIENYAENIRRLGKAGVKVICYNFMPVFDWLRTDLNHRLPDGSTALIYDHSILSKMDKNNLSLPGWDESYTKEELSGLLKQYEDVDHEKLWKNFEVFINGIMPACIESDVKMAIHPDDPPWDIFGLPRIITGADSYKRLVETNNNVRNGFTFCMGSLGSSPNNDLVKIAENYGDRIHFVHARNVLHVGDHSFQEAAHPSKCGSLDMVAVLRKLKEVGFEGYIRPDHGRMIWGETGRPGYGLYDRALGAMYLYGIWEAL